MNEINDMHKIQEIAYEILIFFDEFCENNNLSYVLAGGTLLGAVRHNGFIPWDDDVDVLMPREDYEKFLSISSGWTGIYRTISNRNMHMPYFAFAKILDIRTILYEECYRPQELGVYIDVFPIDGLPDTDLDIDIKFSELERIKRKLTLCTQKIRVGKRPWMIFPKILIFPIARMIYSAPQLVDQLERKAMANLYKDSKFVAFQVLGYGKKEIVPRELFENRIRHKFGERELWIPKDYHTYLTSLFGDYMELPPLDERNSHHAYKAYWR